MAFFLNAKPVDIVRVAVEQDDGYDKTGITKDQVLIKAADGSMSVVSKSILTEQ